MRYGRTTAGLLSAAALVLTACGDDSDADSGTTDGTDDGNGGVTLAVEDFTFSAVTVAPGGTVAVDNRDDVPHTVTAQDGAFDTGTVDAGGTADFVAPDSSGDHAIQCEIHPQMTGVVTVSSDGDDPAAGESEEPDEPTGPDAEDEPAGSQGDDDGY